MRVSPVRCFDALLLCLVVPAAFRATALYLPLRITHAISRVSAPRTAVLHCYFCTLRYRPHIH